MSSVSSVQPLDFCSPPSERKSSVKYYPNFTSRGLTAIMRFLKLVTMPGEPVCLAMMFCDYVIAEQGSGKITLVGTFHSLSAPVFPFRIPRFFIHAPITNLIFGPEAKNATLNLENFATKQVVASLSIPIAVNLPPDQLRNSENFILNLNFPFQNVVFHSPGDHEAIALYDGIEISRRKLKVVQIPQKFISTTPSSP